MASELAGRSLVDCMTLYARKPYAMEWYYASVVLANEWRQEKRNRRRREGNLPDLPDDDIIELRRMSVQPTQELHLLAVDALHGIENLPAASIGVMRLVAQGYTPDEIALELFIPKTEVYWRTRVARELLRKAGYWDEAKKGQYKWIGIRRDHHKWVAAIRVGGKHIHLGYHGSASEAARAYDIAAKEHFGGHATLNFPPTRTRSVAEEPGSEGVNS